MRSTSPMFIVVLFHQSWCFRERIVPTSLRLVHFLKVGIRKILQLPHQFRKHRHSVPPQPIAYPIPMYQHIKTFLECNSYRFPIHSLTCNRGNQQVFISVLPRWKHHRPILKQLHRQPIFPIFRDNLNI